MYHSFYVPTLIFNCQSWTNVSIKDIAKLSSVQLKYLKRMFRVPQSTPNCFMFLETGILPIEHEINRRQLGILAILTLSSTDPVRMLYQQMKELPLERNWANKMEETKKRYQIELNDEQIRELSPNTFKDVVKNLIRKYVFNRLINDLSTKVKVQHLEYNQFKQQEYLTTLQPSLTYTMIKVRCSMLDTTRDRPFLFKGTKQCRLCNHEDESLLHIINCSKDACEAIVIDRTIYTDNPNMQCMTNIAKNVKSYMDKVNDITHSEYK